jgi:hypothetical protein
MKKTLKVLLVLAIVGITTCANAQFLGGLFKGKPSGGTVGGSPLMIDTTTKGTTSADLGLFINNGHTKLNKLLCYDFDNLMLALNPDPEYFAYDQILVRLEIAYWVKGEAVRSVDGGAGNYAILFDKPVFSAKFQGKKSIKFWIFKNAGDPDEKSQFINVNYNFPLTRGLMEYVWIGGRTDNSCNYPWKMHVRVMGGTFAGFEADGTKKYNYTDLKEITIPMAHSPKSGGGKDTQQPPITKSGCYPSSTLPEEENPLK